MSDVDETVLEVETQLDRARHPSGAHQEASKRARRRFFVVLSLAILTLIIAGAAWYKAHSIPYVRIELDGDAGSPARH